MPSRDGLPLGRGLAGAVRTVRHLVFQSSPGRAAGSGRPMPVPVYYARWQHWNVQAPASPPSKRHPIAYDHAGGARQ